MQIKIQIDKSLNPRKIDFIFINHPERSSNLRSFKMEDDQISNSVTSNPEYGWSLLEQIKSAKRFGVGKFLFFDGPQYNIDIRN